MALTLCTVASAQPLSLFQSITTKEGLPSNYVFCASEDSEGFLWIGTDKGLAKYDGFRWQLLTTEDGLPGNYIPTLYKAGEKGLWVGISTKGLHYFNIHTRKLVFVTSNHMHHYEQTDKEGNLFFYMQRPFTRSEILDGFWVSPDQPQKVNVAFTAPGNTWDGLLLTDFANKTLYVEATAQHQIPDSKGFNLANGWKLDTIKINLVQESFLLRPVSEGVVSSDKAVYFIKNGNAIQIARASLLDHTYFNTLRYQNQTIACNEKEGVYFISDSGLVKHYTVQEGLSSNLVIRPYVLGNGKLLLCTLGGGLCYKLPEGNATINTGGLAVKGMSQSGSDVFAVAEGKLIRFNIKSMVVDEFALLDKNIQSIDAWGSNIYISSLTGFAVYTIEHNKLIKKDTIIRYAGISNVVVTGGRLFAGSYGTHLIEYKGKTVEEDSASLEVSEKIQPIHNGVAAYNYEDGLQLNYFNGTKHLLSVKNGLPSNAVYHVHEYRDTLWIGTKAGLAACVNHKIVKLIGERQGVSGSRCIYSFHDKAGVLWLLTDKYLGKYDGNRVLTYPAVVIKDGATDNVHSAIYDSASNTLYTGSLKNLFANKLDLLSSQSPSQQPALHEIIFNSQRIADSSFSIPRQYNQLVFIFRPFNVNPFSQAKLLYKLQGRDEQFAELKDSLSVSFNKLQSGRYSLVVKIINEDGVESEARTLCTFIVKKPFWETPWFIGLSLLTTGVLTYTGVTSLQKRKQKQKEKELQLERQLLNERERISRELHDNLGSNLVTIIAQSDSIETKLRFNQPADALKKAAELGDHSRETMNILRETIWAVQEKSHSYESFAGRIRSFLQRAYAVTSIEWECTADGTLDKELSPEQTLNLFRCVQECTQNIIKHSQAGKAHYSLAAAANNLSIIIKDNGKGFDMQQQTGSNGLQNIQKRAADTGGAAVISAIPGKGTSISIKISI